MLFIVYFVVFECCFNNYLYFHEKAAPDTVARKGTPKHDSHKIIKLWSEEVPFSSLQKKNKIRSSIYLVSFVDICPRSLKL